MFGHKLIKWNVTFDKRNNRKWTPQPLPRPQDFVREKTSTLGTSFDSIGLMLSGVLGRIHQKVFSKHSVFYVMFFYVYYQEVEHLWSQSLRQSVKSSSITMFCVSRKTVFFKLF